MAHTPPPPPWANTRLQVVLAVLPPTGGTLAGDKARSAQCDVRLSIKSAGLMKEKVAGTQVGGVCAARPETTAGGRRGPAAGGWPAESYQGACSTLAASHAAPSLTQAGGPPGPPSARTSHSLGGRY
jgi:hypothetical protein